MFKMYCDNKVYDLIQAEVSQDPQYYYTSYNSTGISGFASTSLRLQILDELEEEWKLYNEYQSKLMQDILQRAVLFDPQTGMAYQFDALKLQTIQFDPSSRILQLFGKLVGELLAIDGYRPPKGRRLGFFEA